LYVYLIRAQGVTDGSRRPGFVAGYIALLSGAALLGVFLRQRRVSISLRLGSAGGLTLIGVLALFSIGLILLLAGALIGVPALRDLVGVSRPVDKLAVAGIGVLASAGLLIGGTYVTDLPASCPRPDAQGGGTSTFHGYYTYTCHGGTLTLST
jgi:hypothetical protein